jgi:hypothetical protein
MVSDWSSCVDEYTIYPQVVNAETGEVKRDESIWSVQATSCEELSRYLWNCSDIMQREKETFKYISKIS